MENKNYLKKLILVFLILFQIQGLRAQTLKSLAEANGKYIGNLMRDGFFDDHQIYNGAMDSIMKTDYNAIVAGNKMKMSNLLKNRPVDPFNVQISDINTADIDRFVAYADANGMRKRGHVMIWYNQIPKWLKKESACWSAQQIYDFSRSYILALASYTAGKIDEWDVLNEAVLFNGYRTGTWYDIVNTQTNDTGKIGYIEYFASLFKWARQGDPNGALFYNDFQIEPFGTAKNNVMRTMVKDMKNVYNAPIDGVGLQSHFNLNQMTTGFIDSVGQTIDDLGNAGFTVNITELDIKICNENPVSQATLESQRIAYEGIVSEAMTRNNCNTVLIWGMSDNDSWIPGKDPDCGYATPFDGNFQSKPAYYGIQEALGTSIIGTVDEISSVNGPNSVEAGSTVSISIDYEALQNRDVVIMFQRDNSPNTVYKSIRTTVTNGVGTLNVSLQIPGSVPTADNDYQYQVYMAPVGGNWSDRLDNLAQINVTTQSPSDSEVPTPVSALAASNISLYSFDLSWTASIDNVAVTGYDIFVDGVLHGNTSITSYSISGLSSGKTYSVSLIAKDGAGNQSVPSTINVTTSFPANSLITSVTGPNYFGTGNHIFVKVNYEASGNMDVVVMIQRDNSPYTIYETVRTTVPGGIGTLDVPVSIPVSVPAASKDYQYQVYIAPLGGDWNDRIDSLAKIDVTALDTEAPSAAAALSSSNITENSFDLSWTAATDNVGVTGYNILVDGVLHGTTSNTFYSISGLSSSTTYSICLVAEDQNGNGSTSISIDETTNSINAIASVVGPSSVVVGSTATVSIDYTSSSSNDIVVVFQRDNAPTTAYKSVRTTVNSGTGTLNVNIEIPQNTPIVVEDYQYQVYITTIGGDWSNKFGNLPQINVSVLPPVNSTITSVTGPDSVVVGSLANISVDYEASQSRDVVVMFQRDNSPYSTYESVRTMVSGGIGTLNLSLQIPETVPVATEDYQYQVYITPVGDNWSNKIDNLTQINVTTTQSSTNQKGSLGKTKNSDTTADSNNLDKIILFNNPRKDYLSIKGLKDVYTTFRIYNISGQEILNKKILIQNSNILTLEILSLNTGMYILNIEQLGRNVQKKFIKN